MNFVSSAHTNYIDYVKRIPLLSAEEEKELSILAAENNKMAKEKIIKAHLKIVLRTVNQFKGYGFCPEELFAQGSLGLTQALKNFKHDLGYRFSTYAMWWVRSSLQEYVLQNWSMVKFGSNPKQKKLFFSLRQKIKSQKEENRDFSNDEIYRSIAEEWVMDESEIRYMAERLAGKDESLNTPLPGSDNEYSEVIEFLVDETSIHPDSIIEREDYSFKRSQLYTALSKLSPREQIILHKRKLKEQGETLEEISEELKLSRERIRQIEKKALGKISDFIIKINA
jgi:RNA polymerase sigma-32 factor